MTLEPLLSKKARMELGYKSCDVSVSIWENMLKEIDEARGDTSRSLWLRRAAFRELERVKSERNSGK